MSLSNKREKMNNSIQIVIVLYHCMLEESITYTSLIKELDNYSFNYELIIYNNDKNIKIDNSRHIIVNSIENNKLADAYNFALNRALKTGMEWLLLLDQDTEIPPNYFEELEKLFQSECSSELVSIVPILKSGQKIISPKHIIQYLRIEKDIKTTGCHKNNITAFNSMSLLKTSFLQQIGGFNATYPLDMLDHWCYNQIDKHDKSIYILDVECNHNSSFLDFEKKVSIDRYKAYLFAENRFVCDELGLFALSLHKVKLLVRSIRQFFNYKNKDYSKCTFKYVFK